MISIIIPTYNRANLICFTLESVIAQSYKDWECLVIDDYSTDDTKEVVQAYCSKDSRIKYLLNQRKKGAQGARNTGILFSKGEYVQFFDSDDIMRPNLLQSLLNQLHASKADIATCFSRILNASNEQIGKFNWINEGNIFEGILKGEKYVDYNSALISREVLQKFGLTDEECPSFQEWDTHIRLSRIGTYTTVREYLVDYYQRNSGTISSNPYKSVAGYLYILRKYRNDFLMYPTHFQKHGYNVLIFAKKTKDDKFIQEIENSLYEIIPNFKDYLTKNHTHKSIKRMFIEIAKKLYYFLFPSRIKRKSGNYISCEETVKEAQKQGLSVLEYVEKIWQQEGQSAKVIDTLKEYGFFKPESTLLEIGAGTGRYIEHIVKKFQLKKIYSYETAEDWSYYLEATYKPLLVRREADGFNLNFEDDESIDNITAHGVFVYLPFLHAFHYFKEMARVLKKEGLIAFDIYALENFNIPMIENWLMKGNHYYPVILDKQLIIDYFKKFNIRFLGEFNNKHGHSYSTYLVFQKNGN